LIDAVNKEVREIDINHHGDIVKAIGCEYLAIGFNLPFHDICYVNDDGLLDNPQHFFTNEYAARPYAGNGVIVGQTSHDRLASTKVTLEGVRNGVKFYSLAEVQEMIREGKV